MKPILFSQANRSPLVFDNFPKQGQDRMDGFGRLKRSQQVSSSVGYDEKTGWTQFAPVLAHLKSEVAEFEETVMKGESKARQQDELGDVLYIAASLGLQQKLNPRQALEDAVDKFVLRFNTMQGIHQQHNPNVPIADVTSTEWKQLWKDAKKQLANTLDRQG